MKPILVVLNFQKVLAILIFLAPAAHADTGTLSISSGISRIPKLSFESLSVAFFGETKVASDISIFTTSFSAEPKNGSNKQSSNKKINYSVTVPPLRFDYSNNSIPFFDTVSCFIEYSKISFPEGIGMFTEKGRMSALTSGIELTRDVLPKFEVLDLGIGYTISHTKALYSSALLNVNSDFNASNVFIYLNADTKRFIQKSSLNIKAHNKQNFEILWRKEF